MALIDDVLATINASLLSNLSWLDVAYGKIQRMKRQDANGVDITFPGIYTGGRGNDYVNVLPDQHLGKCYSYFEVPDPIEYENINRNLNVSFKFKLAIWFDWRELYPADYKTRSIEEVKSQVLNVLMGTQYTRTIEVFQVYEDANSIFQSFTNQGYISSYDHKILEGQFLMKPYGGLAISGEVHSMPTCTSSGVSITIPPLLFGLIPVNYSNSETIYALETWYGEVIYFRTWNLDTGANADEDLTGLVEADIGEVVRTEMKAVNSVDGTREQTTINLQPNGSGGFKVFVPDFYTQTFVTVFYTK